MPTPSLSFFRHIAKNPTGQKIDGQIFGVRGLLRPHVPKSWDCYAPPPEIFIYTFQK
jgi:hypothetical protein